MEVGLVWVVDPYMEGYNAEPVVTTAQVPINKFAFGTNEWQPCFVPTQCSFSPFLAFATEKFLVWNFAEHAYAVWPKADAALNK